MSEQSLPLEVVVPLPLAAVAMVAWEMGRKAAGTPAGQRLMEQGAAKVRDIACSPGMQGAAFNAGSRAVNAALVEHAGVSPGVARVATKVVADVGLRTFPDKKLRPEVAEQASRVARAAWQALRAAGRAVGS